MNFTQTVDIPADHRITLEVPQEIPAGKVILTFTPALDKTQTDFKVSITEKLNNYYRDHDSHLDDDLKTASYRLLAEVDW